MKKQLMAFLALALLLSGCSAQSGTGSAAIKQSSQAEQTVAMGRYVEKDFSPDFNYLGEARKISMNISQEDNIIVHLYGGLCKTYLYENGVWDKNSYRDEERMKPVIQKYMSHDTIWFQSEDNARPYIFEKLLTGSELVGPDGYTFTVGSYRYTESYSFNGGEVPGKAKSDFFMVSYNGTDARYYNIPEYKQATITNGAENESQATYGRISRQNVLILKQPDKMIFYDISKDSGKKLGELALEIKADFDNRNYAELAAIIDNSVLVVDNEATNIYDLSTGEKVAQVDLDNIQRVCEGADGAFYAINKEGIWRILPNGGIVQRVVDGATCSFAAPGFNILNIIQDSEGSFYVAGISNRNAVIYKYEFTKNLPLERKKTLHLWSFKDNDIIREAAAQFMRQNPEVKVYIEIAPKDVSHEQAAENLIIALRAGTGPDLIVTDGMDLDYFAQQKVLADLSDKIDLSNYDKRLLPSGQADGKQLALGTRLVFISSNAVKSKKAPLQLEQLLETLKASVNVEEIIKAKNGNANAEIISPFLCTDFDTTYEEIYSVSCAEIWKNGYNKAAAETVLQLLSVIKAKFVNNTNHFISSENYFYNETSRYNLNGHKPVGLYGKANFVLKRMIACSASTQNLDLCADFIEIMLSENVQNLEFQDSCAVTNVVKTSYYDKEDSVSLTGFVLDFLITNSYSAPVTINNEDIQIITENYVRDDGFKAIAFDYIEGKIDLDTALAKAEKLQ